MRGVCDSHRTDTIFFGQANPLFDCAITSKMTEPVVCIETTGSTTEAIVPEFRGTVDSPSLECQYVMR